MKKMTIDIDSDVKATFKGILREIGIFNIEPAYDITLKCFTVMKVYTEEEANSVSEHFLQIVHDEDLKGSVRRYEETGDIWVFKLYV